VGSRNFIGAEIIYNRSVMQQISYFGFAGSDISTKINNLAIAVSYSF
jgi:hypothetical protein